MRELELLAPARDADIGIAAIDCGADAVYIAGPRFGARQAAGNGFGDIERLCSHAHRFGAKVFVTLNTILYDEELPLAEEMLHQMRRAGADAVIVQDMALVQMMREGKWPDGLALHFSTQCAVRDTQTALWLTSLGCSRIVLEREMSLQQIREISALAGCEIEFFVHGALCVCYSGQCYLSEKISGRSANRGACIQACRSKYDLADSDGRVIVRDKALLSLRDYNLKARLRDLADAGVMSFKIEGRLKNISYVRNTVRAYSLALDKIVEDSGGLYRRASYGKVSGGFVPNLDKTFNRGYTELFIDGRRGKWAAMDAAKSMGEELGTVTSLNRERTSFAIRPAAKGEIRLSNGDGLCFVGRNGEVEGVRADVCEGLRVHCKSTPALFEGAKIFRNYDMAFEKQMNARPCVRRISVKTDVTFGPGAEGKGEGVLTAVARAEDGRLAEKSYSGPWNEMANSLERMEAIIRSQLSKSSGDYSFELTSLKHNGVLPLISSAALNSIRHELAAELDGILPSDGGRRAAAPQAEKLQQEGELSYKANISNSLAETLYTEAGFSVKEKAYELTHREGAELMRTKYCIRYELGLCPKQGSENSGQQHCPPLYLMNNGQKFTAVFDCRNCEMIIKG